MDHPVTYTHEVRVRYAETDRMGVLHHSRIFVLLELARTEMLRRHGMTYRQMEDEGWFLVIVKASCDFKAPAHYDDVLLIETTITRVTQTRIDHAYRVTRKSDGELIAEAETTLACLDRDGSVQRIPGNLRELLGV
ncbi:MAG: thioesterase [Planctomycetes bacterium DG_58]|nr:MAG: thioesterase [Planctomycetes bacterium DG_58]KPL03289.1 MAG: thioesterase [Planctomycetes bacterium SM23_65]